MANICTTNVVIEGDKSTLKNLERTFKANSWLSDAMKALGERYTLDCARTSVDSVEMGEDGALHLVMDSAWTYPQEVFDWLENELGLDVYFIAEEPGLEIYQYHDPTGKYFRKAWHTDIDSPYGDCEEQEFSSLEDALAYLSQKADMELESEDDVEALNNEWLKQGCYIISNEYEEV